MRRSVTDKQSQVLDFIIDYYSKVGHAPDFSTIKDALHMSTMTSIYTCVRELETKGYLSLRTPDEPALTPLRRANGAWLHEPPERQPGQAAPIIGTFKHGFLPRHKILDKHQLELPPTHLDDRVDFAAQLTGFSGVKRQIDPSQTLLFSYDAEIHEDDIIIERLPEGWKLSHAREDKELVAVMIGVMSSEFVEEVAY